MDACLLGTYYTVLWIDPEIQRIDLEASFVQIQAWAVGCGLKLTWPLALWSLLKENRTILLSSGVLFFSYSAVILTKNEQGQK